MWKEYFKDKVAIVTGGASGLGRELCLRLLEQGAIVVIADMKIELATAVRDELV